MFEGIALGSSIAAVGHPGASLGVGPFHSAATGATAPSCESPDSSLGVEHKSLPAAISMPKKLLLAGAFALVTPIGMAIGIGALKHFNGNDPATVIALGTLDAFSAGILVWVGVVEMLAHDWMLGGDMSNAKPSTAASGILALVAGMALMSFLGKWA